MEELAVDIVRSKEEILKVLLQSKISGAIVGITAKSLGIGTYLTNVLDVEIEANNAVSIQLRGYDMTGYFFDKSTLSLDEIESAFLVNSHFDNPFLRRSKETT